MAHPSATIAWGIDLGEYDSTGEGFDWDSINSDSYDFENGVMPGLFGFTEPFPEGGTAGDRDKWWDEVRTPYQARLDTAIPVTIETYGYQGDGSAVILKRSRSNQSEEGNMPVDPATLAPPAPGEMSALITVLDHLGYEGDRTPRLLLMATYG